MTNLYLLIGSYDEGAEIVYPFQTNDELLVMKYILEHRYDYEPIFRSIRQLRIGEPETPVDLLSAIEGTYVDGDSVSGWTGISISEQNIVVLGD